MKVHLKIKNYRCFTREQPLELTLDKEVIGFLGVNNSGKSTILKFFVELRHIFQQIGTPGSPEFRQVLQGSQSFNVQHIYDPQEIFNDFVDGPIEIEIKIDIPDDVKAESGSLEYADMLFITIHKGTTNWSAKVAESGGPMLDPNGETVSYGSDNRLHFSGKYHTNLSQLVTAADKIARSLYVGPFRNTINIGHNEDYFDIQVGEAFIKRWRGYKTGPEKAQHRAILTLEKELTRIFGFDTLTIDASNDERTLQLNINGDTYKLHEVGSGLSQFIMVLANALIRKPTYILIDEPELGLHPSLQLDFLTTLGSYASEGMLFATHSVGLGRSASDKLYSVIRKDKKRYVKAYEATENLVELLGEMSFSGYRELGFDKVLLVEGPTEVKTIQQFLKFYGLDHKVVLLSLGGASLINGKFKHELSELTRLSTNIFCLIDSEKTAITDTLSQDRRDFVKVCKGLKIDCHVLERRATENYLTERAVQEVKSDKFQQLSEYQKLADINPAWGKNENWVIAAAMQKSEIENTDLGKFLGTIAKT